MSKVIKGEFEKIKDVKVKDVSLICGTPLEVFYNEVSRLCRMDDDLFTYEVEAANIHCDPITDNDSKHEANDEMGYDPSDKEEYDDLTRKEACHAYQEIFRIIDEGWMVTRAESKAEEKSNLNTSL
uniref:Uncharacterized protein n=1 Tax=Tanacetum cinerariifolium TaxID=118510 RepID=A0A699L1A7_TANCI|nr:hypothetical protein [Tanacetum cinerariifolium]